MYIAHKNILRATFYTTVEKGWRFPIGMRLSHNDPSGKLSFDRWFKDWGVFDIGLRVFGRWIRCRYAYGAKANAVPKSMR